MIKARIVNSGEDERGLVVDKNNSALVSNTGVPPVDLNTSLRPFTEFFKDSTGAIDMRVDGSVNYKDFFIGSSSEGERYIHTLAFTIADAGASLKEFGGVAALSVGCSLIWQDSRLGDVAIAEELKSNFDFVQLCNFEPTFGSGTAAFLASNVIGSSEAFIPILDIEDVFGLTHGLRIPQDTNRKLILRIFDDVSAIDRFDIKVFGYDRIEHEA